MESKLIKKLYDYWACTDDDLNESLFENLCDIINNKGKNGAEELLDWCRCEYDRAREDYSKKHDLTDEEMEEIMEDNCGSYEFMYEELPYVEELEEIWDLCNFYLDYCEAKNEAEKKEYLETLLDYIDD